MPPRPATPAAGFRARAVAGNNLQEGIAIAAVGASRCAGMSRDDPRPGREPAVPHDESVDIAPSSNYDGGKSPGTTPAWDAGDPRRCRDQFAPPQDPCECWCMHCRRTFMSDGIWFQRVVNDPHGFAGFWRCPTPNCDGAGFTFDIHPTDPDHPANEGWCYSDDDEEEDDPDEEFGDAFFADASAGTADAFDDANPSGAGAEADWDPDEAKYKELDEMFGEDDDIEGEEWKYGLQPGERPPEPAWAEEARREEEAQERRYDEPDERPRVVDWSDRVDRQTPPRDGSVPFDDDDIPF